MSRLLTRPVLIGLVAALAALGAAGVAFGVGWTAKGAETPTPITISGTLTLTDTKFEFTDGKCRGSGGYDDIAIGAAVTITDAAGTTIALGKLAGGQQVCDHVVGRKNQCRWSFRVEGVPGGKDFYGIEVSSRGRVQFTAAKAAEPILLNLGG